jgi:RHS repeat-associated protein
MTSKTVNGVTTNYSYNGANELTNAGYGYDANGNETQAPSLSSLVYNSQDQTTSITPAGGSATAMGYAGVGQTERTSRGSTSYLNARLGIDREVTGATTTYYVADPDGTVLGERNPVGGSGSYYFLFDGLRSVAALTNSSGSVVDTFKYDAYGNDVGTTGSVAEPFRFAGGYYDTQTGLYKFGIRYYDPAIGRWTQRDVIDDPLDQHGWNRYIYAGDDPVNLTDREGAFPCPGLCKTAKRLAKHAVHFARRHLRGHQHAAATLLVSAIAARECHHAAELAVASWGGGPELGVPVSAAAATACFFIARHALEKRK